MVDGKWSKVDGDHYREIYDCLSFNEKVEFQDKVLTRYHQVSDFPGYILEMLYYSGFHPKLNILELGGYNGVQAAIVLSHFPNYSWTNCDVSKVAKERTVPLLKDKNYKFKLLDKSFSETPLEEEYDLFYSSRTLEHMRLSEVLKTIDKTSNIPGQIHIIDYFWNEDTHVLEEDSEKTITDAFTGNGYHVCHSHSIIDGRTVQLRIMGDKRH